MTLEKLKSYRAICAEIKDLEQSLSEVYAGDAVSSASDFPYSKHTVHIEGYPPNNNTHAMLARLAALQKERGEIRAFVENVTDHELKLIINWRYIKGKRAPSWQNIALKIGYVSEHTPVRKVKHYLNK